MGKIDQLQSAAQVNLSAGLTLVCAIFQFISSSQYTCFITHRIIAIDLPSHALAAVVDSADLAQRGAGEVGCRGRHKNAKTNRRIREPRVYPIIKTTNERAKSSAKNKRIPRRILSENSILVRCPCHRAS